MTINDYITDPKTDVEVAAHLILLSQSVNFRLKLQDKFKRTKLLCDYQFQVARVVRVDMSVNHLMINFDTDDSSESGNWMPFADCHNLRIVGDNKVTCSVEEDGFVEVK